jgi:hypothetical protein
MSGAVVAVLRSAIGATYAAVFYHIQENLRMGIPKFYRIRGAMQREITGGDFYFALR